MEIQTCCICQKPKAQLECGLCHSAICKKCVQFVDENTFSFYEVIPKKINHTVFCGACYTENVVSEIAKYDQLVKQAQEVFVFYKDQGKETRRMPRDNKILQIKDCADRDEAILRLAFLAVLDGYTTLVDVDLHQQKIRQGSYQHSLWHATAVPVKIEHEKLKRK